MRSLFFRCVCVCVCLLLEQLYAHQQMERSTTLRFPYIILCVDDFANYMIIMLKCMHLCDKANVLKWSFAVSYARRLKIISQVVQRYGTKTVWLHLNFWICSTVVGVAVRGHLPLRSTKYRIFFFVRFELSRLKMLSTSNAIWLHLIELQILQKKKQHKTQQQHWKINFVMNSMQFRMFISNVILFRSFMQSISFQQFRNMFVDQSPVWWRNELKSTNREKWEEKRRKNYTAHSTALTHTHTHVHTFQCMQWVRKNESARRRIRKVTHECARC